MACMAAAAPTAAIHCDEAERPFRPTTAHLRQTPSTRSALPGNSTTSWGPVGQANSGAMRSCRTVTPRVRGAGRAPADGPRRLRAGSRRGRPLAHAAACRRRCERIRCGRRDSRSRSIEAVKVEPGWVSVFRAEAAALGREGLPAAAAADSHSASMRCGERRTALRRDDVAHRAAHQRRHAGQRGEEDELLPDLLFDVVDIARVHRRLAIGGIERIERGFRVGAVARPQAVGDAMHVGQSGAPRRRASARRRYGSSRRARAPRRTRDRADRSARGRSTPAGSACRHAVPARSIRSPNRGRRPCRSIAPGRSRAAAPPAPPCARESQNRPAGFRRASRSRPAAAARAGRTRKLTSSVDFPRCAASANRPPK